MIARRASVDDAAALTTIYNEGIEDRVATFETRLRHVDEVRHWFDGRHPIIAITHDSGRVIAFAATFAYRPRECYAGIAETSVYVARDARGRGAGRMALQALIDAARDAGFWKLLSRIFPENHASRALVRSLGFREVGIYQRHAQLDGKWRDVVIVELVIRDW